MLTKIRITNFQTHRDVIIKLGRITCIIGKSDVGKSAILRALRWVCLNQPSGDAFIRRGRKFVSVRLRVGGRLIRRHKGKENSYELDGKKFVAFGSAVPPEIADLLNVGEVNFQGQHDPPYWLSDSAGQVSRNLNSIINLGVIDSSLSSVASDLRRATTEQDVARDRLKEAKTELADLEWIPQFNRDLTKLEAQEARITAKRTRMAALASILEDMAQIKDQKSDATEAISEGRALLEKAESLSKRRRKADRLRQLLEDIEDTEERLCNSRQEAKKAVERLQRVRTCPLCGNRLSQS